MKNRLLNVVATTLVSTAVACGGSDTPTDTTGPTIDNPPKVEVDLDAAKTAALALLDEQYVKVAAGDIPGYAASLATDVFWFGSAHFEAIVGRDAVIEDLNKIFGPAAEAGATFSHQSAGMKAGVAPDGKAVWVSDELELSIAMGDAVNKIPYRITSVVVDNGGQWMVAAQNWSVGIPNEAAIANAASGGWKALTPVPDAVAAGAEPIAALVKGGAADASAWLGTFSEHADAFAFGSAPEEKLAGGATVKGTFSQLVAGYQMKLALKDGITARLAGDSLAWAACNLDVTFTVEGNTVTQPYRALFVYLKEGADWKIVQVHFSNGVE